MKTFPNRRKQVRKYKRKAQEIAMKEKGYLAVPVSKNPRAKTKKRAWVKPNSDIARAHFAKLVSKENRHLNLTRERFSELIDEKVAEASLRLARYA